MDHDTLYQQMKLQYQTMTGETVRDDGDLGLRMQVVSGELATAYEQLAFYKKQLLPQTATGEFLARHAACRGIAAKMAAPAEGSLTFSNNTAVSQDILIPAGTTCTASGGSGVLYATTDAVTLPAGATSVTATAVATESGKHTNIGVGAVDTIIGGIAGIAAVQNNLAFTGGQEAEDDETLRARLLASFVKVSTGANRQFYEDLARAVNGVHSAQAVASGTTVTVYISDIFRMTSDALIAEVQTVLDNAKALGVTVNVVKASVVNQNIAATIFVDNLQSHTQQVAVARSFLQDRTYHLGIGDRFNPYTLANGLADHIVGLQEIVFSTPTTATLGTAGRIFTPGTISVTIAKK